ncbi:hypothetical protein QZH41_011615, partial [Actinostola sp. cb2023]
MLEQDMLILLNKNGPALWKPYPKTRGIKILLNTC